MAAVSVLFPVAAGRFLRNFLPSAVTKVSNVALKKFLTFDTPELQRVLLVTKKKLSPMPYDRLSLQFDRRAGACGAKPPTAAHAVLLDPLCVGGVDERSCGCGRTGLLA